MTLLLTVSLPQAAFGDAVQAAQSDKFVDSIGVATHLNVAPTSTYWSTIEPLLTGLGVRHIRDGVYNSGSSTAYNPEFVDLSVNHGIKSTLCMTYYTKVGVLDPTQIPGALTYLQDTTFSQYGGASLLSAVEGLEGANEYDLNCPGGIYNASSNPDGDANWVNELTTYQQAIYNDVTANSAFSAVTLVGPAMGTPQNQTSLPDMAAMVIPATITPIRARAISATARSMTT